MKQIWEEIEFCTDLTRDVISDEELSVICAKAARTARRRRLRSQLGVMLLALAVGAGAWRVFEPPGSETPLMAARPSPAIRVIRSEQFTGVLHSQPLADNRDFFAAIDPVQIISSPAAPDYQPISDEQLLGFFGGRAVALIKSRGTVARLEFLDEEKGSNATTAY